MKKCVKITLQGKFPEGFLFTFVKQQAQSLGLEGTAQMVTEDNIRIILCGDPTTIDRFMDFLHKHTEPADINSIELEPFLKEKDYRGVFRVIE
ncbi:MAG TPA: acylphosphatase [Patescibacteria group bacterium]|jgi:acylphosphatase|nr:acylphosphatase [Patescibacteria group bacterium]